MGRRELLIAKVLSCRGLGINCSKEIRAEDEEALLKLAAEHAEKDHGIGASSLQRPFLPWSRLRSGTNPRAVPAVCARPSLQHSGFFYAPDPFRGRSEAARDEGKEMLSRSNSPHKTETPSLGGVPLKLNQVAKSVTAGVGSAVAPPAFLSSTSSLGVMPLMSLLFALSLPLDRRVRAFLARAILTESGNSQRSRQDRAEKQREYLPDQKLSSSLKLSLMTPPSKKSGGRVSLPAGWFPFNSIQSRRKKHKATSFRRSLPLSFLFSTSLLS